MPKFKYRARDRFGKVSRGVIRGSDKESVARYLAGAGYTVISVKEMRRLSIGAGMISGIFGTVSLRDINIFTRQLLTLHKAGISLLTNLDIIEKQTEKPTMKKIVREMAIDIEQGTSLSAAMSKYKNVFNKFYVSMIKAAEASGQMDDILGRLLEFGEREEDTISRIKLAVRYPSIVIAALIIAFVTVVTFVIPRFALIFAQFKTELPLPTRIILGINFVVRNYWEIILLAMVISLWIFLRYINTKKGKFVWDGFKLKIPVIGHILSILIMSHFTRTMSLLMRSGLPMLEVLEITSRTSGNSVVSRAVEEMIPSVKEGKGVSEPMEESSIFPPIVVNMVAIGEKSGNVDELLESVAEYYDNQLEYMIKNATSMLEPFFLVVLGGAVLTLALAIFLPMWNLINLFKH